MKEQSHSHSRTRGSLTVLTGKLRKGARSITGPRAAILEVLQKHPHPLTVKEIAAELPHGQCDLATVYRSMGVLEELEMVKRFDFGDGTARFELLVEGDDGHHHHLICGGCGSVVEIEECLAHDWEEKIASRHGFESLTHKLEFFGLCPKCQNQQAPRK